MFWLLAALVKLRETKVFLLLFLKKKKILFFFRGKTMKPHVAWRHELVACIFTAHGPVFRHQSLLKIRDIFSAFWLPEPALIAGVPDISQEWSYNMTERKVDVMDKAGKILHTYMIAVDASIKSPVDHDYEKAALHAAKTAKLVPEAEFGHLKARAHTTMPHATV